MRKAKTKSPRAKSPERKSYLLDTSAILALMEDEAGADRVETILRTESVFLPFVVPLEVYYITLQEKNEDVANTRYAMLKALEVTYLPQMNEPTLLTAGRFKARHKLSLADAMIAALAAHHGAILVHKDPEYEALKDQFKQESLPYKN